MFAAIVGFPITQTNHTEWTTVRPNNYSVNNFSKQETHNSYQNNTIYLQSSWSICPPNSIAVTQERILVFIVWASSFNQLLGRTRFRGRCWAANQLSHHPEPSGRTVHGESLDWHWRQGPGKGEAGGNAPGRHFWWKEGVANGLSRMNLKLDLGFRFWFRLDLPYVPVWLGLSRLAKCPGISLQLNIQINSSLMMHCYEIIPSWKAWLWFNPWLGGRHFSTRPGAALPHVGALTGGQHGQRLELVTQLDPT